MQVDVRHERLALGVYLQNRLAAFQIRCFDGHLTVETTRAQQCRIEHIRTVGRSDDDEVRIVVEAVHLDEQLVQRLLALVVTTTHAGTTLASDGVDLVDEDDGRGVRSDMEVLLLRGRIREALDHRAHSGYVGVHVDVF